MKKLILFFALVFSTFALAQNKEFVKTYDQFFTLKDGKFTHYQKQSVVHYNYKDSDYILIECNGKDLLLKISNSKAEMKQDSGNKWLEFYVETEDGKTMRFGVFEQENMGCMITDGVTTLGFNNIKQ